MILAYDMTLPQIYERCFTLISSWRMRVATITIRRSNSCKRVANQKVSHRKSQAVRQCTRGRGRFTVRCGPNTPQWAKPGTTANYTAHSPTRHFNHADLHFNHADLHFNHVIYISIIRSTILSSTTVRITRSATGTSQPNRIPGHHSIGSENVADNRTNTCCLVR
jgi:hypothetical protein